MKFIDFKNLMITFLLISLISSRTIKDKNKKLKSNLFKDDEGSGSWETFYDCPRINIRELNKNYISQGSAKIYGELIEKPITTEDKLGLVFDFNSTPGDVIKNIGTLVSGNKYYIPYRNFNGNFIYTNPSQANKYIEGSFISDDAKHYEIKIEFPFKKVGRFINDTDSKRIMNAINNYSTIQRNLVNGIKGNIQGEATKFFFNKKLLEVAEKGSDEFKKLIGERRQNVEKSLNEINELQNNYNSLSQEIKKAEETIYEKKKSLEDLNNRINSKSKRRDEDLKLIEEDEKNQSFDIAKKKAELHNVINGHEEKLLKHFKELNDNAPVREKEIQAAKGAYQSLDKTKFNENLKKIVS